MEKIIGPFRVRSMYFEKSGDVIPGHYHNFDHMTLIITGAVRIRFRKEVNGQIVLQGEREYRAPKQIAGDGMSPSFVLIKKDVLHEITALEDHTYCWCVFTHRDINTGEIIEEWNGWNAAAR